jgi:hypothetical protein
MSLIVVIANFKVSTRYPSAVMEEQIGNTSDRIAGFGQDPTTSWSATVTVNLNRQKTNRNKLVHQLQCLYWNTIHQALTIQHHTQFRYKQCHGALNVAGYRINISKRQCSTKVLIFIRSS